MKSLDALGLTKVIEEKRSKYNGNLRVVKTLGMGTYIQAEGLTQSGGIVETIWRETLRKVKSKKSEISSCLILGLGGGTVAKLINKYWYEVRMVGIDMDSLMIDMGKKYLGLDRLGVEIKIGDAFRVLKNIKGKFDLIIVDLYCGDEFSDKLEEESNISLIRDRLDKSGVAVFNRLYYGDKRPKVTKFGKKLEKTFDKVDWFYPEANLMFICSD